MSLSDLAALGSFCSGLAVLASLIFLYFQAKQLTAQVKQAEKNQQAIIQQNRASRMIELTMRCVDPSVLEGFYKGVAGAEDISDTEIKQFWLIATAAFRDNEDSFYQHTAGLMNEMAFASFESRLKQLMSLPGYRVAWKQMRSGYGDEFAAWLDRIIAEREAALVHLPIEWRAAIAAEKAQIAH